MGKACAWCKVTETSAWRLLEETGQLDLCNACGLQHAKGMTMEDTRSKIKYARGIWPGRQRTTRKAPKGNDGYSNCTGLPHGFRRKARKAAKQGIPYVTTFVPLPKRRSKYRSSDPPLKKHKELPSLRCTSPPLSPPSSPLLSPPTPANGQGSPCRSSPPVPTEPSLEWADLSPELPRPLPEAYLPCDLHISGESVPEDPMLPALFPVAFQCPLFLSPLAANEYI